MNDQELALWLRLHGGEVGRKDNERQVQARDEYGRTVGEPRTVVDSTTIEAADGATITLRRREVPTGMGPHIEEGEPYARVAETPPDKTRAAQRTPAQTRADEAAALAQEQKNQQAELERREREWNQSSGDPRASGLPETHLERAEREAKAANDARQREATNAQIEASRASTAAATARITQDQAELGYRRENDAANRGLTERQIAEQERAGAYTRSKPDFLNQADTKTPYVGRYDPTSGQIVYDSNPNYDAVKAAAEERRAELASQVQVGTLNLAQAKQAYEQWFEGNVRTPLMLAQEARAKAEEQRQALEAEERRRQFAADYRLRKATLGETAAQRATSAEISLLPYRSGPTWGADISSAINSLAGGGKMDANAAAGIHFSDSSFAFSRPDFKQIAKDAAKAALSGLTDYRPSDDSFATGDYTNVPQVNLSGMPQYSYSPVSLPEPSAGAALPPE